MCDHFYRETVRYVMVSRSATAYTASSNADEPQTFVLTTMATHSTKRRMIRTYMRRKLTGMVAPSTLRRLALAGMVALLVGGAPLAQTPEPAQDDSIETVRTRANAGDAEAQRTLGAMYEFGLGVTQNGVEAVAWYRQAAEQGHAGAQYNLGTIYGIAPPSTPITAQQKPTPEDVADIRVRAEQGEAEAQYQLGKMYEVGRGIAGNLAKAVAWYRRAADQGHASAQFSLGGMYARGEGVAQDTVQAHMWFHLAAARSTGAFQARALRERDGLAGSLSAADHGEAQRLAREWEMAGPR